MAFDYLTSARDAYEELADAGALTALSWTPAPATDDPSAATPDAVTASTYGVIFDYGYRQLGTQPDSLILAGDRQIYLAALDPAGAAVPEPPPEADVTGPDGVLYRLVRCKPLNPAGVVVLFELQVRRP